ncbi:PREDICTED: CMRF35-like molecule 3 [Calidris pugnax]|uniref:CMRF35-like molecule 3 n=1 Tax=Calidris pugnax TaxID=198806 RepID=UPI00071DA264|nr:PREDICTED: CMRF35-like molecule 3 [Calidris pugnax]
MGISPGWVWLLLPVCQALVVPAEVSGRVGETLSIRCWYPRGYESYNKYWCRGGSRDSCHKVVETKGREVPWQHGRFSVSDNHVFCVVLLTVKNILEVDAGSYWCGIERTGRDLMEVVTVRVAPVSTRTFFYAAALTTPAAPQTATTLWISTTLMEHPPDNNTTTTGSSPVGPALSTLVPVVVLLSLLAVAGSAGLLYTLHRRREGGGTHPCTSLCLSRDLEDKLTMSTEQQEAFPSQQRRNSSPVSLPSGMMTPRTGAPVAPHKPEYGPIYDNMLDLAEGDCSDMEQDPELEDPGVYANTLCLEEGMGMPGRHFPGEEVSYMS